MNERKITVKRLEHIFQCIYPIDNSQTDKYNTKGPFNNSFLLSAINEAYKINDATLSPLRVSENIDKVL